MAKEFSTFAAAAKDFFGLRHGSTMKEFMGEVKALSDDDKKELAEGMSRHGIVITSMPGSTSDAY